MGRSVHEFLQEKSRSIIVVLVVLEIIFFILSCLIIFVSESITKDHSFKWVLTAVIFSFLMYFCFSTENLIELTAFMIISTINTFAILLEMSEIAMANRYSEEKKIYASVVAVIFAIIQLLFYTLGGILFQKTQKMIQSSDLTAENQDFNRKCQFFSAFVKVFLQVLLNLYIGFFFFMDGKTEAAIETVFFAFFIMISVYSGFAVKKESRNSLILYLMTQFSFLVYIWVKLGFLINNRSFSRETVPIADASLYSILISGFFGTAIFLSNLYLINVIIRGFGKGFRAEAELLAQSKAVENNHTDGISGLPSGGEIKL